MPPAQFTAVLDAERLYEEGDRAPYGSAERADAYRRAALAQRQAEAAAELERHTKRRRKAA
jgi:hypothetical protein